MMHQAMVRFSCGVVAASMMFAALGCGEKKVEKFRVTGKVSLDGEPVKDGYAIFYPTDSGRDADTTKIVDGQYELMMPAGPRRVEITANRPMVPEKLGPLGGPEMEQYIPAQYNKETTLNASVLETDTNVADFELKSK